VLITADVKGKELNIKEVGGSLRIVSKKGQTFLNTILCQYVNNSSCNIT